MATTQVVGRDRYIEWVGWMANVSTSIEKVLQEVRNLQRSEIAEVAEAFDVEKQVGSSTMAHKRNPITAGERLRTSQNSKIDDYTILRKCLTLA